MSELEAAAELMRKFEANGNQTAKGEAESTLSAALTLAHLYLAEHPADDDEPADIDWLCDSGAKSSTDGLALILKGDAGPEIVCGVNRRSGEDYVGSLGLYWSYHGTSPKVSLSYLIDDDPTRGDVRQLCRGLKIPPTDSRDLAERTTK